ncbi:hypothetical protein JTB14_011805 [Gonioctena quinquepunctata]|nr:hypothetical protein JTB14_011805 [Gonioctena quinquepunctata]
MESEFREKINLASKPLLTFPKTPNYKTCGDYLISRNETKENGSRAFIREGHIVRNASIANHLSKKQLFQTEQRLRQIKHISSERREALDAQWKDLAEKEEQFRENFIYFDKFIHENIEKERDPLKIPYNIIHCL